MGLFHSKYNIDESLLNEKEEKTYDKTIVIVSGFFDPIGVQHIVLFEEAAKLGDHLIVGVNSDNCGLMKKKQPVFMPFEDRKKICESLYMVDEVVGFEDSDGSACQLIQDVYDRYKEEVDEEKVRVIFANGGDRAPNQDACPEQIYVEDKLRNKVDLVYGVGGFHKTASSSDYLRNWVNNTCKRYKVDFELKKKY